MAKDDTGHCIAVGRVLSLYASLIGRLSELSYAQLRDRWPLYNLAAVIRRETGPAGPLTILGHGKLAELSFMV